ncbi:50S ribosomal protein L25 [Blattabacterium cuenoti]|uniref:50S ribosomal protein L25 n=1 Tax=Blattabacterium cuenoti TaxID=1653831 RepID=UPI00163BE246|nr:50S ribosomal protein L25 [Blattabacterium cuenoti]
MNFIKICGIKRKKIEIGNKKFNRFFRKCKKIPCIIYGKDFNIPFYTTVDELNKIINYNKKCGVFIKLEDDQIKAIPKEIQYDVIKDTIIHVDFYKLNDSIPIILHIPIEFIGRPIGVIKGGRCSFSIKELTIKSLPNNIPECIKVNIDHLDIGDKITVKNIEKDKFTILQSSDSLIVKIKMSRIISKEENKKEENKKEENKKEEDKKEKKMNSN